MRIYLLDLLLIRGLLRAKALAMTEMRRESDSHCNDGIFLKIRALYLNSTITSFALTNHSTISPTFRFSAKLASFVISAVI